MAEDESFDVNSIENLICADINNNNDIKESHPEISRIACIKSLEDNLLTDNTDAVEGSTPTLVPVAQEIRAVSYIVGAAAAIVIVLGIYGYRRRHRNKGEKVEVGPLDDSDLANMSNSLSYEGVGPYNGAPALDFTSIHKPAFTAQGGIEAMARQSYFPVS